MLLAYPPPLPGVIGYFIIQEIPPSHVSGQILFMDMLHSARYSVFLELVAAHRGSSFFGIGDCMRV